MGPDQPTIFESAAKNLIQMEERNAASVEFDLAEGMPRTVNHRAEALNKAAKGLTQHATPQWARLWLWLATIHALLEIANEVKLLRHYLARAKD